jgi:hypothetical protein
MFIRNFQGTYECPSTAETPKTIKQKHDESLWDYVKCFCNVRNVNPYIQDIDIINAFYDGVSDIKNVEEIAIKKHRTVADLLTVAMKDRRGDQRGGEWEPIKIPQRNLAYIPKSTRTPLF